MSTTEAGRLAAFGKPDSTSHDGVSLQAVNEAARRLDELSCARIVGNLADAVHTTQKGGQPLGTLSPAAIRVLADGSVKLVAGAASPHYTAPEKLRGRAVDRRADVFVLGVVLWEALAHERLFEGATEDAIKRAVFEHAIRPPSELNANVPAELDAICKKALARDPSDRYQSAKVMAAEIDAVLGDAGYPESNEEIAAYVAHMLAPVPVLVPRSPVLPAALPPSVAKAASPSVMPRPTGGTLPQPFVAPQPAPTAILGSTNPLADVGATHDLLLGSELPEIIEPPLKPVVRASRAPATSAKTEILGSVLSVAEKPVLSVTAFAPPAAAARARTPSTGAPVAAQPARPAAASAPPAMPERAASTPARPPAAPSFAPPAMPEPADSTPARPPAIASSPPPAMPAAAAPASLPSVGSAAPAPIKPTHPQPPIKASIANAETIATPQLPAHLAVQPAPPQLGMPPGMTVAPSSPPAPLQSADQELNAFEDEHHADPAEVIALHHAERTATSGGRDVLAGWGWATGSVEAIDDDDVHDTSRAGKRRLMIAIGGSLAAVLLIAAAAVAFSGSKEPSEQDARSSAAKPSPTAPVTPPSAATPEPGVAPPSEPTSPPPEPAKPEPIALPPSPEPASVEPARPEPASVEPAKAIPAEPPKPEPARPEPANVEPAKASAAEPARPEPAKVAAAIKPPAPPKAVPPKAVPPKAVPPKKLEARKPAEAKKSAETKKPADKAPKRPPPEKLAKATPKAQPLDPYATPAETTKTDPAAAYKTSLQQYARGDITGALSTLRTSLSSNPTFAPTWRGLGLVYEKQGNKGQARSAFKRYLQLAPDAGDADQIRERLERLGP